ncbi:MAG: hypothetical protein ABEI11_03070 [Haloarculaceae archaeon]
MTDPRGRLSYLAIGTIFLVVLGSMHLGVQYSRGELLEREPPSDLELDLRDAVRAAADAERADRGLAPARRETSTTVGAQAAATALAGMDYFAAPTAAGVRPAAGEPLPNGKGFCHQLPAKLTVSRPGWPADGGEPVADATIRAVTGRLVELFDRADGVDALGRPNTYTHGIGIAVRGDVVYAVYRTCNLGY